MFNKGQLVKCRVDKKFILPKFDSKKKNDAWKFECVGVVLSEKPMYIVYWSDKKIREHFSIELESISERA